MLAAFFSLGLQVGEENRTVSKSELIGAIIAGGVTGFIVGGLFGIAPLAFGFVWTDIAQILPKSPNKNLDLYISIIGDNGETIIHYEVEVKKRIDLAFPT